MAIRKELLDELFKDYQKPEDDICENGILQFTSQFGQFSHATVQRIFRPYRAYEKFWVRINPGLQPGLMYFALSALENNK